MVRKTVELHAQPRTLQGKKTRHLRREGLVPGHVYGHGKSSLSVQIEARLLKQVLATAGINSLVTLVIDGNARPAVLRGVAREPLTGAYQHVDLQEVSLDEPIKATVPVVLEGESPAAKGGLIVVRSVDHVTVEALPADLPSNIHVDVSGLTSPEQAIHVRDLHLPPGVRALDDPELVVAKLAETRAVVEEVAPAEEELEAPPRVETPVPGAGEEEREE